MLRLAPLLILSVLLPACAAPQGPMDMAYPPGAYPAAFRAARETLRDLRFDIERVDSNLGVITSVPQPTAGIFTPWDQEQSTIAQEFEDCLNRNRRLVRITFEPAPPSSTDAQPPEHDSDWSDGGTLSVLVSLIREARPGWRLDSQSISLDSRTIDPTLVRRGMVPAYNVAYEQDELLARRIVAEIKRRMETPETTSAAEPPVGPG